MLSLNSFSRYFIYQEPADMRCGIYSLAGLIQNSMKKDPLNGDVFIFIGKAGNQIRLLQWDNDGFALYIKRLEKGTFERPVKGQLQLSTREVMLILQGIKLKSVELRKRFTGISATGNR